MKYGGGYGGFYGGTSISAWTTDDDGVPVAIAPGFLDCIATARGRIWKQLEPSLSTPGVEDGWYDIADLLGQQQQDVENQRADIHQRRYLSTASGDTLEEIGASVGRGRDGLLDADYRRAIKVDAATLFASGTRPEIIELATALFPLSPGIWLRDRYPAGFDLEILNLSGDEMDLLQSIFADVPPAGVGGWVLTYILGNAGGMDSFYGFTDSTKLAKMSSNYGGATDTLAPVSHGRPIGS